MKQNPSGQNFSKPSGQSMKIISNCPICNFPYNSLEAKLIQEKEQAHLIYIRCRHCFSSLLALITLSAYGISSLGIITDLEVLEINKLKETRALSSDEMLQIYDLLKGGKLLLSDLTKTGF